MRFSQSKKGFIGDLMTITFFMFIIAIFILVAYLVMSNVNDAFQATDDDQITPRGKTIMQTQTTNFTTTWDSFFGFMLVAASIAAVISAFLIDVHPVFLPLSILVIAIFIGVGAIISNAYYEIESDDAFSVFAEDFTIMHYIMNHLPYYIAIQGFLISIALYAKSRSA